MKKYKIMKNLNEKFTEDSDAVYDMGIGMEKLMQDWFDNDLHMKYPGKDIALSVAARHGKIDFVKYLIERGANPKKKDSDSLQQAAMTGNIEIAKYLLSKKAKATGNDSLGFRTAARNGDYEMTKLLLDAGADVNAKGGFALKMAKLYGHKNIINLLKQYGATENIIVKESLIS